MSWAVPSKRSGRPVGPSSTRPIGADPPHGLVGEQKTMFEKERSGLLDRRRTAGRPDSRSSGCVRSMSAAVVGSSFSPKPNRRDSSRDQLTLFVAKSSSQLPIWAMLWTSAAEFSSRFMKMAKRMELTRSRPSSILLEMWLPAPVSIVPMPRPASSLSVRTSIATAGDEPLSVTMARRDSAPGSPRSTTTQSAPLVSRYDAASAGVATRPASSRMGPRSPASALGGPRPNHCSPREGPLSFSTSPLSLGACPYWPLCSDNSPENGGGDQSRGPVRLLLRLRSQDRPPSTVAAPAMGFCVSKLAIFFMKTLHLRHVSADNSTAAG